MTLLIILFMLLLNAALAAYEMALASASRTKLSILAQEKRRGAESALYMKDHMEGSLATIQIGITLVGALSAAVGGAGADEWFSPILQKTFSIPPRLANGLAVLLVVLPLSFVTIVFAELIPKTFALKNKEFVVLTVSPAMRYIYKILYPIVMVMENIVRFFTKKSVSGDHADPKYAQKAAMADLRTAVSIASSSRLFGKAEEKIVLSSAMFCVRKIKEIQVPIDQVYVLNADDTIADTFIKAHLDMHTRFPICQTPNDRQSIIGYLNFKDIFSSTKLSTDPKATARSVMRPIVRLDEETIISTALEKMMKSKQHLCLVVSGETVTGILTLEDIFEEMVGEIEDEYDFFPAYIRPFGQSVIASATASMGDVYTNLQLPRPEGEDGVLNVEHWAARKLGRAMTPSDIITDGPIRMSARKFRRHKLMETVVTRL